MKRTKRRFASTSGDGSNRKNTPELNIQLTLCELIPQRERRPRLVFAFLVALAQMLLLLTGLCLSVAGGLDLPMDVGLLFGGIAALCLLFTLFYFENWLTGARVYGGAALTLVTAAVVLFQQKAFLSGAWQLGSAVLERMNNSYGGDYMIPVVESSGRDVSIFLLLCAVPIAAWLGASVVQQVDALITGLLVFPLMALLLLTGAQPPTWALMCVLLGILSVMASGRVGDRQALWGRKDTPLWNQNRVRRRNIRSVCGLCAVGICGLIAVPSFYVLMPSLAIPVEQAEPFSEEVKGRFVQSILSLLPERGSGNLSSPITVSGGGVEDGSLRNSEGYLIEGVEDLLLRCSEKPGETIYLRGFIGGNYEDSQWTAPEEGVFSVAAENWDTEGDPAHYLYNLPFLRMLYEEQTSEGASTAAELTVERINASDRYTYLPYGSYLNDYYEIGGGDGGVLGQSIQDDIFRFYFREDQLATLDEEFFMENETALDRLERSYDSFAKGHYTLVPEGFSDLEAVCADADVDSESLEEVIAFVQEYLTQNYRYSLDIPQLPEGEDAIAFFLRESKTGFSPHFASAATIMFRSFGIPARYVVGYAASQSLFTAQPDGSWQAVLQSDDAHAWVEIYIGGVGWMPVETTPGTLGIVQDMPYYGDELTPQTSQDAQESIPDESTIPAETAQPEKAGSAAAVPVLVVLGIAGVLTLAWILWRRIAWDLGLDEAVPARQRVRNIFAAYYRRLLWAGMPRQVESTSPEFSRWVALIDPELGKERLEEMMALVLESTFGQKPVGQEHVKWMRSLYREARKRIRKLPKDKK